MALWNENLSWNQDDQWIDNAPVFGRLWWDFAEGVWAGEREIAESLKVSINIYPHDDRSEENFDPTRYLPDARRLWLTIITKYPVIHGSATQYNVKEYARVQQEFPGKSQYSNAEIATRLIPYWTLINVGFWTHTSATVSFADGQLFDGHSIDVDVSETGEQLDVSMNG